MRFRYLAWAAATGLFLLSPAALALPIDSFIDDFPPNPDLPLSGRAMIFVGTTCDGGSCPPNPIVTHTTDFADQVGLPGVMGGARRADIFQTVGTANSLIAGTVGVLTFNHNAGASAILDLDYGAVTDLDADLTFGAATALEFDMSGDMGASVPTRPVPCTITVTSGRGTPGETTTSAAQDLIFDGLYSYPFASFAGVDFTDVDRIQIRFDASLVNAVDFAVFAIHTNEVPVPVEDTTWGRLKALYK